MINSIFGRIFKSSKVQATFLPFIVAVIVAALNGTLKEEEVTKLVTILYTNVIPVLLVMIGGEDIASHIAGALSGNRAPERPAGKEDEWKEE